MTQRLPDLGRWKGRVALVTGASSGIGEATATALAAGGMRVAFCARREEALLALADKITAAGGEPLPVRVDLREEEEILTLFDAVREAFGGVDVLINNAGLGHHAPLVEADAALWREMLDVNVVALSVCTREAIRDLRARKAEGHVIHVSSMAAHRVPRGSGMYAASKHAVRALTEALRMELHDLALPIRITAVSPGFVETGFAAQFHKSDEAATTTYGRFKVLESQDVARVICDALATPPHVQIHDILMRPREQPS